MPVGIIVNCLAVVAGGAVGSILGERISLKMRTSLTLVFGACAMTIGISCINKMDSLTPVVLSAILGLVVGELINLDEKIQGAVRSAQKPMARLLTSGNSGRGNQEEFMESFISILVLFCASGTGIFGSMQSGMTGDHSILFAKSVLDLFTSLIFAANLGPLVCTIAVPQFAVMILCFLGASLIMPLTNDAMLGDFSACGGLLTLATGLRIAGIKNFPVANMLPSMILAMPVSWLWNGFIMPLL